MVRDDAASDQAVPRPAHASNGLWPGGSGDRLGPRRGSRLPHDVPEALVTSPVRGSGAVEGAPGVALQPGPAGQVTGSDTGVVGDRSDVGRSADVGQRGLGELLRRWEDVQPDDTATTFPGAKPIPMRNSGTTPPEDAPHAGPPDLTPPNAPPFDATSRGAIPFDATRLGTASLDDTRLGATPLDDTRLGAAPFDATSLSANSLGTAPLDAARLGANSLGAAPLDDARLGATPFGSDPLGGTPVGGAPGRTRRPGGGSEFSGTDHVVHTWPAAVLAPADLLGNLEDEVEEALEALVLREAERYGLDAGAP